MVAIRGVPLGAVELEKDTEVGITAASLLASAAVTDAALGQQILRQLVKINFHLERITDERLSSGDVEALIEENG